MASLAVVLLYAPHMIFYFGEINLEVINQFLEAGMFIIVGMITGYLVEGDFQKRSMLERKIMELADLENYTHNVLDSLDSGVFSLDKFNNITTINKRALMIFEDRESTMIFLNNIELFNNTDEILSGEKKHFEKEFIYEALGGPINLLLGAYPLKNIEGAIEGVVVVLQDITTLKQLEEQLRRSERLSAIGQMASGIAHEIRNPLGIIKTISQAINKKVMDDEIKEGLMIINDEINRANRVIKELLNFAKPYRYNIERISLKSFLIDLVSLARGMITDNRIEIVLKDVEDCYIEGDEDKLKQAFLNIVLNALQSMKNVGNVEISTKKIDDLGVVISIRDEGEGISKEMFSKVFNPFFTTKDTGTGLGLSITHRIIDEHGGNIELESEINKGTVVKVFLELSSSLKN